VLNREIKVDLSETQPEAAVKPVAQPAVTPA
jgi:hypothetical protein